MQSTSINTLTFRKVQYGQGRQRRVWVLLLNGKRIPKTYISGAVSVRWSEKRMYVAVYQDKYVIDIFHPRNNNPVKFCDTLSAAKRLLVEYVNKYYDLNK